MSELFSVPLDRIQLEARAWPRTAVIEQRVHLFVSLIRSGEHVSPVELVAQGDVFLVADGVHRVLAARQLKHRDVSAVLVSPEPSEDPLACAYRRALETSTRCAVPLTVRERRKAVGRLLADRPDLSHRTIARLAGVSHDSVDRWARELPIEDEQPEENACAVVNAGAAVRRGARSLLSFLHTLDEAFVDGQALSSSAGRAYVATVFRKSWGEHAADWSRFGAEELLEIAQVLEMGET